MKITTPAKIFRYCLAVLLLGVAFASWEIEIDTIVWLMLIGGLAIIIFKRTRPTFFIPGLLVISLLAGLWRYQLSLPIIDENQLAFYNGQKSVFIGTVKREPDVRLKQTKLLVEAESISQKEVTKTVSGRVLISTELYPEFFYGDRLKVNCRLKQPEMIEDFDYPRYLAKDRIYSLCYQPKIELIGRAGGNYWLRQLLIFKKNSQTIINRSLPEPYASLFFGINFGNRGGIDDELVQNFNATGTTHLLAISGMNITLIVGIITNIFLACYFSRRQAFWLTTFTILAYLAIIGFPASAFRAGLMGWLLLLAVYLGRVGKATNAMLFAAVIMVLINPKILRDDISFQLSFLSVMGLIYLLPVMYNKDKPGWLSVKENLAITVCSQLATMPVTIFSFGRISLIAPIVNIFVVFLMLYLIIGGFLALLLSALIPGLSLFFFLPIYYLLAYLVTAVGLFAGLPGITLNL